MTEIDKTGRRSRPSSNNPNSQISSKLRQFYDGVREQEIPPRFLDLLEKLDEAERVAKSETQSSTADQNDRS